MSNSSSLTPIFLAYSGSIACSASIKAQIPPIFCASATACRDRVVFPDDSGPKISIIRPRGKPPIPRASSRPNEPVGIASISTRLLSFRVMIESSPNLVLMARSVSAILAIPPPFSFGASPSVFAALATFFFTIR